MTEHNHWQLMPAAEYECPTPPTVMRLQRQWRRLLRTLGVVNSVRLPVNDQQSELAPPDFSGVHAQTALTEYLAKADCGQQVCWLLDPPFSGTAAMARTWGWQQGRALLVPPTVQQITAGAVDEWWLQQPVNTQSKGQGKAQAWLIDDLTRYFLRTTAGLGFIRAWFPRVLAGEFGTGLIVCDSWAYAFLSRDWPQNLPRSHCLAPVTPDLLRQLGLQGQPRQLTGLSGEARGNLGIAWELWRYKYLEQQSLPVLPVTANDGTAFILYALLLHRGLNLVQLAEVLSNMALDELKVQLLSLQQRGIIEEVLEHDGRGTHDANHWRLTAFAYLPVRDFLGSRDYLLDHF